METHSAVPPAAPARPWVWAVLAALVTLVPLSPGLTGSRIFYIRDLSLYFWGRYLWLRHEWLAGRFPLWDPYVGAGQAAVADAMHQMFLLPASLLRLIGSEVLGFNLWVLAPFPLAAVGMWLFQRRRFSPIASALGAVAFALSGPVYATSNFPNMSWTVAGIPWVLLAADRLAAAPSLRRLALLALAAAGQAMAGEPVTQFGTLVVTGAFVLFVTTQDVGPTWLARARRCAWAGAGIGLGLLLAAVQLLPLADAAAHSVRTTALRTTLFWSLHPLALLETVAPKLFGDYYTHQSLATIPWVPVLNSGREPFFFSLYLGVPLLALVCCGLVAGGPRRWSSFWAVVGGGALIAAAGSYTPVYPWVSAWLPWLTSFRFPAKYIVLACLAVSAGAAAGWDALCLTATAEPTARVRRAHRAASGFALVMLLLATGAGTACLYYATPVALQLFDLARRLRSGNPVGAAEFMLASLPPQASVLLLISLVTLVLIRAGRGATPLAGVARYALLLLVAGDLVLRAWPVNPTFDPAHLREPAWLALTKADPHARFYVGGKRDGTLDATDVHSSRAFLNPPGLIGSASRAALSGQTAFYPSAWQGREMLSYDLAVLWPRTYLAASREFFEDAVPAERDRFLQRTGVRYRVLTPAMAGGRPPIVSVPYYLESSLYDFGPAVAPRVSVVPHAQVVRHPEQQLHALFNPAWDDQTVLVTAVPPASGAPGPPAAAAARIVEDTPNAMRIEASAPAIGGYLLLLDSFADGWQATVDGRPAAIVQANGLFRAVRLPPGRHQVAFAYRPRLLVLGASMSASALLLVLGCLCWPSRASAIAVVTAGWRSAVPQVAEP